MDDIVVSIKDVSKVYKLYDKPIDRLKESCLLRIRAIIRIILP